MIKTSQQIAPAQQTKGTLAELDAMKKEISDLTSMGIQIPDAIKMLNDPNQIKAELDKIKDEASNVADATKNIASMADKAFNMQNMEMQRMQQTKNQTGKGASMKPFNLKKAQQQQLNMAEQLPEMEQPQLPVANQDQVALSLESIKPQSVDELIDAFLDQTDYVNAKSQILGLVPQELGTTVDDILKSYYETDWETIDDPRTAKIQKVMPIWEHISSVAKGEGSQPGVVEGAEFQKVEAFINDVNNTIKKLAESDSKKKNLSFNLMKQAQAKTTENIIMYGPEEKRFDPFLRQPISDWHIVERNKGFGLVVDDIWNIDYESIWRGTIMDKYSRPYRDTKTGEWIGGYIQKRFEVDKWIPEENNYQLLPGQRRKPFIPERSLTEARLEAMREKDGEKKGFKPSTEGKPFNWKKAQIEKESQIRYRDQVQGEENKLRQDMLQLADEVMQTPAGIDLVVKRYVEEKYRNADTMFGKIKKIVSDIVSESVEEQRKKGLFSQINWKKAQEQKIVKVSQARYSPDYQKNINRLTDEVYYGKETPFEAAKRFVRSIKNLKKEDRMAYIRKVEKDIIDLLNQNREEEKALGLFTDSSKRQNNNIKIAKVQPDLKKKYIEDIKAIASEALQSQQFPNELATQYVDSGAFSPEQILFEIKSADRNEFMVPFGKAPDVQPNLRMPKDLEENFRKEAIKEVEKDIEFMVQYLRKQQQEPELFTDNRQVEASNKKKIKVADLPAEDRRPKGATWLEGEPLTQIIVCNVCNARLSPKTIECPNCHSRDFKNLGLQDKKKDIRGVSPQPRSKDMIVVNAQQVPQKKKKLKKKEPYRTEEIKMMSDPLSNTSDNEDIEQSINDLCIDG